MALRIVSVICVFVMFLEITFGQLSTELMDMRPGEFKDFFAIINFCANCIFVDPLCWPTVTAGIHHFFTYVLSSHPLSYCTYVLCIHFPIFQNPAKITEFKWKLYSLLLGQAKWIIDHCPCTVNFLPQIVNSCQNIIPKAIFLIASNPFNAYIVYFYRIS